MCHIQGPLITPYSSTYFFRVSKKTIRTTLSDHFDRDQNTFFNCEYIATMLFCPENLNLVFEKCTDNNPHDDLLMNGEKIREPLSSLRDITNRSDQDIEIDA